MIIGLGTDIIEIDRLKLAVKKYGRRFLDRIYTEKEQKYFSDKADPFPHMTARFAAKEACSQSLGRGMDRGLSWKKIEIQNPNMVMI